MKSLTTKLLFGLAAATLAATAVADTTAAPAEVRFAWAGAPRVWVLGKADKSFDQALGVPVKWVQFNTGADVLALFASKQIDIARFGSNPAVSGYAQGLPIELISVPEIITTAEQLVVRADIRDVKGIEGRTIAYPPNSTAQYALEALLDRGHADRAKVKLVPLKPAEIVAAWKRGDIDGAYAWDPAKAQLVADGAHVVFSTGDLRKDGVLIYNNFVVSKDFAAKYPQLVAAFLKNYQKKVEEYRQDPERAAATIAATLDQPLDSVRTALRGMEYPTIAELLSAEYLGASADGAPSGIARAQAQTAAFLVKAGQLQSTRVPASFVPFNNASFLRQAGN
ncbi:taurine ABC transporter substrate-binding protein [Achromobacter xylosoxidans]|uniref:ABC transporter substrate-binding protein n=1 Tax=Alcaligenes xylosoxydans xylosoxydans TaxID=85698 RepID=UPI00097076F3|nr:ABC transporter substrate-binding protein [Achromobacter xylosoxidans]OMG77418.1 taurine ABC transporter substrate-binding protein [Achromobacter xylosoxidans]